MVNKRKTLIIIGESLMTIVLVFSCFTFAWFQSNQQTPLFSFNSGTLEMNVTSTNVYKYVYSKIPGTELVDYVSPGTVNKTTITNNANELVMNIFDPTSIKIIPDVTISSLNTNLVLEIDFSVTYSTAFKFSMVALKNILTTTNLLTSDYIHFTALTSEEYEAYSLVSGITSINETKVFDNVKKYSELSTHPYHIFPCAQEAIGDNYTTILSNNILVGTKPNATTTSNYKIYLNIDYDDNLTNGKHSSSDVVNNDYNLYSDSKIGYSFLMEMDYSFVFHLEQV